MTPTTRQLNYRSCCRNVAVWQAPAAARSVRCQAAASSQTEAVRAGDLMGIVPWAVKNGVQFAKIKPAILPDSGRGLIATADIQPGECVCDVPVSAAIRVYPGCPTVLQIPQTEWQQLPWYGQLALTLLNEQRQGADSKWCAYIRQLPTAVDVPVLWSEAEVQQLQCGYFIEQVQQQQQDWAALQQQVAPYLTAAGISTEQLQWALCITRSRTFAAPYTPGFLGAQLGWLGQQQQQQQQQHVMCPFLDLFNHRTDVQSECEFYSGFRSSSFRVVASQAWSRGEQVFINYGSGSNDILALQYGFVPQGRNPDDRYIVRCLPDVLSQQGHTCSTAAAADLVEVVFTGQGLTASAAMQLSQLLSDASIQAAPDSDLLPYTALGPAAKAACAAAVQQELTALAVDPIIDDEVLCAFEELPTEESELLLKQADLTKARSRLQQMQEMLREAQEVSTAQHVDQTTDQEGLQESHVGVDHKDGAAGNDEKCAELLRMRGLCEDLCEQLQVEVEDLQQNVMRWRELVQRHKLLAVLYRTQKQQLLTDVLLQLGGAGRDA